MWIPTHSDAAVASFARLAKQELGLELDYSQAREAATQVLHMHFLKEHCAAALRPEMAEELGVDLTPPPEQATQKKLGRPRTKPVIEFRPFREG